MRESPAKRLFLSALFAIAAGLLVAHGNPVQHIETDLDQDFAAPISVAAQAEAWLTEPARG